MFYIKEMPNADEGPFLKEEITLLDTIADRLSHFITFVRMKKIFKEYKTARKDTDKRGIPEWRIALNLLRQTNRDLYLKICRRLLNFLSWSGIREAELLQQKYRSGPGCSFHETDDENRPLRKSSLSFSDELCDEVFKLTDRQLYDEQILFNVQKWIQEDRLGFLVQITTRNLSFAEISDAVHRYIHMDPTGVELPASSARGVTVSLIRRFLSDHPQYITTAKNNFGIKDFNDIFSHVVFTPDSYGKLGGKSAGLLLASKILQNSDYAAEHFSDVKIPKSWFITSDILAQFLEYNKFNEVVEQKYKEISQVHLEYPHVVETFKNCHFPPEILQGLSMALDDFGDKPLIVRSSSLLEDRIGAVFSGKYKSLFLANQGTKEERLAAFTDAIAEVYASTFGPDPIEYRSEKGLLDIKEEMAIMIQEVVGNRVGDYFIPTFAGVAFSRNEFRWSPRIKREDGLLRLVPGLGTRAVDRTSDDYPVLIAPGQIGLRVNITVDEIVRYSPKMIDVINLKTNTFETIRIEELFNNYGDEIPGIGNIISVFDGQQIRRPMMMEIDFEKDNTLVTFDGLVNGTKFVDNVKRMLAILENELGSPVDIEFASDGKDFYLLQCRPQSYSDGGGPVSIPSNVPVEKIIFSAEKYISNGYVPDISHIVYVDPLAYDAISNQADLVAVGRAIGNLNKLLPRRRFILMGPGRWGSRGDIKLGVRVTYSDISNTAMLIEVARKKGNYLPDLSFGTHFFQDLVESAIRYLPLYPDDEGIIFNEKLLNESQNILPEVSPDYAHLSHVIKVIDVSQSTGGNILQVLLNADLDKALAILAPPTPKSGEILSPVDYDDNKSENHWSWRLKMAGLIASRIDPERFGVNGIYVFGSTKDATARPDSDIDLIIHFNGSQQQKDDLLIWLDGWSVCLDEMNCLRTGYKTGGLLDCYFVTEDDIAKKTTYAQKIDSAQHLPLIKKASVS
ncbi:MAG: pyruvate, phosphate dikinase [candidate division Zixibacteria bacterium]|nr:pyruvate, phosphate dikinase [candidate division Zixibacteria bacterium]